MPKDVADTPWFEPAEASFDLDRARSLRLLVRSRAEGRAVRPHAHPRSQLAWPTKGVLRIVGADGVWIVPPSHAAWIPGGVRHQIISDTDATIRHLLVHPDHRVRSQRGNTGGCVVVMMTPLLRELVLRLETDEEHGADEPRLVRLREVILDEIDDLPEAPLDLPGGRDARLVRLTRHLGAHPEDPHSFARLASQAGSTTRTLERLFRAETGLTFRRWRSRLRLLRAIEMLDAGDSTTRIALSLGYAGASAFAAAFKEHFGQPPQSYLLRGRGPDATP
jgi:AraC-like DNA-binding protein